MRPVTWAIRSDAGFIQPRFGEGRSVVGTWPELFGLVGGEKKRKKGGIGWVSLGGLEGSLNLVNEAA